MIVTVTPGPSLDLTYVLPAGLDPARDVHRARSATVEAGGKGVNVSRALARVGLPTLAVLPVAGATGRQFLDLLDADRVQHRAAEQSGMTRVNTAVVQPGRTIKINAPSPPATIAETDMLVASAAGALAHAREADPGSAHWLAVCGSLAGGRAEDVLRRLVGVAHTAGARCAVDTSSGALAAAVRAKADLLAPNAVELADLVGPDEAFATDDDVVDPAVVADVAAGVARATGGQLLVSIGARGAVWTDGVEARHAEGPPLVPQNTAGGGDAVLAGWLAGPVGASPSSAESGAEGDARLGRAVAWGAATCLSPGTVAPAAMLRAADVHGVPAVTVKPIDLTPR